MNAKVSAIIDKNNPSNKIGGETLSINANTSYGGSKISQDHGSRKG